MRLLAIYLTILFLFSASIIKGQTNFPISKIKESLDMYHYYLQQELTANKRQDLEFYYQFSLFLNNGKDFNKNKFLDLLNVQMKKQNEDAFYASCLLAEYQYSIGNYALAKSLSKTVITHYLRKSVNKDVIIAWANSIIGSCMFIQFEDKTKTIEYLRTAHKLFKPDFINEVYARNLMFLGTLENSFYNFETAIKYFKKANEAFFQLFGENNLDYISSLQGKAISYYNLGNTEKAIELAKDAHSLLTTYFKEHYFLIADSHYSMGTYYSHNGQYEEFVLEMEKAYTLCTQHGLLNDYLYGKVLSGLAFGKHLLHDNVDAIKMEKTALDFFKKNNYQIEFAMSLSNLGLYYSSIEDNKKAISYCLESLNIFKNNNMPSQYANTLSILAQCYGYLGDYSKSIMCSEECTNLKKQIYGENHIEYIKAIGQLGVSYYALGNKNYFKKYIEEALLLSARYLGKSHPIYAETLGSAAIIMLEDGNVNKAYEYTQEAIDIYESKGLDNTLECRIFKTHLIDFKIMKGNYEEAISDILKLLPQEKKQPMNYRYLLRQLMFCYKFQNNLNMAYHYGKEHISTTKKHNGDISEGYIYALDLQRDNLIKMNKTKEIIDNYLEQARCIFLYSKDYVILLTDGERLKWWEKTNDFYKEMAQYAISNKNNIIIEELYKGMVLSKGISLNVNKNVRNLISLESPNILKDYSLLLSYKKQYEYNTLKGKTMSNDSLHNIISHLERKISQEIKSKFKIDNYSIGISDIKKKLNKNDLTIEFINYHPKEDSIYYAALLLRKEWETPKIIPLNINNENIKKIWKSIETYLSPGDNIYFSASGILHQIPIESLPIGDGKIMSDVYNMHRLSSTRELVKEKKEVKYTKAALYGGLNYDMTDNDMLAESQTYSKNGTEEYFVSRGLLEDSIRGYKWDKLSNTQQEVDYISDLMAKNQITTQTYKGNKGNEESFKALSGHEYNIIHLATHGFFYPDEEAKEKDYFKPMLLNDNYRMYNEVDMSMWRSGLVMSGGNRAWKGDTIPDTVEDGILKAQEIGDLDLRGADLVVLSACNTGQGEVTGEGVFGLQRAFKMAGAQTIVMSLTPVDDQTTMAMMNKFYTNLFSGQSKHDAFYNAQRYIRSVKPDPKYWMGWIMLD